MPCDLKHLLFEGQRHARDIRGGVCAHADRPGFVDPDGLVPTLPLDAQTSLPVVLATGGHGGFGGFQRGLLSGVWPILERRGNTGVVMGTLVRGPMTPWVWILSATMLPKMQSRLETFVKGPI